MKRTLILCMTVILLVTGCSKDDDSAITSTRLRHVVLFKFKDGSTLQDIKKIEDAFRALPTQIKQVRAFEWGINNSPENLNQGFTHSFLVSFSSEQDRDTYLPHPAHQAFVALLSPHLEKALVIDYWALK